MSSLLRIGFAQLKRLRLDFKILDRGKDNFEPVLLAGKL